MLADAHSSRFPWVIPAALVLVNLIAKGAFLNINLGEYTDGILQLTAWEKKAGLYPPLYGVMSHGVALVGVSLEQAARIVSLIAASLCVVPVWHLARRIGGSASAALFAAVLYTASPMPWRWSVRVMTDSLYLLLSTGAIVFLMEAWAAQQNVFLSSAAGDADAQPAKDVQLEKSHSARLRAGRTLAAAILCAGLAGLTRYQGALLAPLLTLVFLRHWLNFRRIPWLSAALAVAFFAVAVWWVSVNNFVHGGQFTSRTGPTPLATVMAWINTAESFVLISPYYFGYPVVAAALIGVAVIRRTAAPLFARPAVVLWSIYAAMLLALHAAFGSFQYRYMMPLLPMVVALAGIGFAWVEKYISNSCSIPSTPIRERSQSTTRTTLPLLPLAFRAAVILSLIYLVGFSLAILTLQRETYGDQHAAADFIRENTPPTTSVFSNERYGNYTHLGSVKLSWWTGRPVQIATPDRPMPAGSILVLGTAYGGNEAVAAQLAAFSQHYELRPLTPAPFRSRIVPLMDDIMTNPMFNQNPLAWVLRYVPQTFATQIFQVQPRAVVTTNGA